MRRTALALALVVVAACGATPNTASTGDPATITETTATDSTTTVPLSTSSTATDTTVSPPPTAAGDPAPDFTLQLGDGSNFVLSAEQRPVFMVFWAEW